MPEEILEELTPYKNADLGVAFALPNMLTVQDQLLFRGGVAGSLSEGTLFIRLWYGARRIVRDWQCEKIPDPLALDLTAVSDPAIADIIVYVANVTSKHVNDLSSIEKNGSGRSSKQLSKADRPRRSSKR